MDLARIPSERSGFPPAFTLQRQQVQPVLALQANSCIQGRIAAIKRKDDEARREHYEAREEGARTRS
jgi:hypothetical protein